MTLKKTIAFIMVIIGLTALILKLKLRIESENVPITESITRFLSYFTILSNLLVTIYFSVICFSKDNQTIFHKPGSLTAIAAFMCFVGLAYHILLRHVWDPKGLVMVLDETHHTFAPIVTIIFWFLYEIRNSVKFKTLSIWVLYPILYLIWILVRGHFSSFYPYYFVDVNNLGLQQAALNAFGLLAVIVIFLVVFYIVGKKLKTVVNN